MNNFPSIFCHPFKVFFTSYYLSIDYIIYIVRDSISSFPTFMLDVCSTTDQPLGRSLEIQWRFTVLAHPRIPNSELCLGATAPLFLNYLQIIMCFSSHPSIVLPTFIAAFLCLHFYVLCHFFAHRFMLQDASTFGTVIDNV